jgi:hypothetical protein
VGAGLARSHDSAHKRSRKLLYLIPVIALVGTVVVYAMATLPIGSSPTKMDFTDQIIILMENDFGNQTRGIVPKLPVGEAGGYWYSNQYNGYGVDPQHYPLYMNPALDCVSNVTTSCTIHVKSTIIHQYILGDFFNVWGQSLGQNNTVGVPRVTNTYGTFAWQMCIGPTGSGTPYFQPYGTLVLQPDMDITLIFYNTTNGIGCA